MTVLCTLICSLFAAAGTRDSAPDHPEVRAYLFNPSVEKIVLRYPHGQEPDTMLQSSSMVLEGRGFLTDGTYNLSHRIEGPDGSLHEGEGEIEIVDGWFEVEFQFTHRRFPEANGVAWSITNDVGKKVEGHAHLRWSRFHGNVEYRDGGWHDTRIILIPVNWGAPGGVVVPVQPDGRFDAQVPSRVYAAVIVVGTGYLYDSLVNRGYIKATGSREYQLTSRGREALFEFLCKNKTGAKDTIKILQQLSIEINQQVDRLEKETAEVK